MPDEALRDREGDGDMSDLEFIMERVAHDGLATDFALFACRGAGRGCPRNKFRSRKVHCDDCLKADNPNETLVDFKARLERGDA